MNKIQTKRLEKMATHLETGKLGHENFYFAAINMGEMDKKGCGTLGCAIGELPIVFPRSWEFDSLFVKIKKSNSQSYREDLLSWFGLRKLEANHLFYPDVQRVKMFGGKRLYGTATKEQVASNIRAFLKIKTNEGNNP